MNLRLHGSKTGVIGCRRHYTSLIEVMVAIVLLSVLILASASYLQHSATSVIVSRNRRAVIAAANRRLEELRATPYRRLAPSSQNDTLYYLLPDGRTWQVSTDDPEENLVVNDISLPMVTTVQYGDRDPDDARQTYDYLKLTVRIKYRLGREDEVVLQTFKAPF